MKQGDLQAGLVLEVPEKLRQGHEFSLGNEVAIMQLIGGHLVVAIAHHSVRPAKLIFCCDFRDMTTVPERGL